MLVTVGALLVIVLVLGGLLLTRILLPLDVLNSEFSAAAWIQLVRNDTPELLRYILTQDPIDTELVRLIMAQGELQTTVADLLQVGDLEIRARTVGRGNTLLLDSKGVLVGTSSEQLVAQDAIGQPLDPTLLPGLEGPLEAALAGDLNAERLFVTLEPNEEFYFTVPLVDESGQEVIGVAVVYVERLPTEDDLFSNLILLLGRSAMILLISAALMGLIFGFLTAKGMVDRLQHASDVTEAWSKGDFSAFIKDSIQDEIGQLSERLNQMALQLQALLRRREEMAVVEERNRLARDLHDSAKQQALAASFQIGTALTLYERDSGVAKDHLQEAERLVDNVRQELTDLIMELRPPEIDEKSISTILSDYIKEWSQQHDLEVEAELQAQIQLSNGSKQTLLRILQESLANIARHSEASHVHVILRENVDEVMLVVKDNGVGFNSDTVTSGVGLHSIRERVDSLDGTLVISSRKGDGTSITVRIPQV
jgi:NarL family two-component system sensor histidine kinase LiaS